MSEAEILELTYDDIFTVRRRSKVKNEVTGVTETVEIVIVQGAKGSLSKNKSSNANVDTDGIGKITSLYTLFCNPTIDIEEGDFIEVNRMNKISIYLASKPFSYESHSEIGLSLKERV